MGYFLAKKAGILSSKAAEQQTKAFVLSQSESKDLDQQGNKPNKVMVKPHSPHPTARGLQLALLVNNTLYTSSEHDLGASGLRHSTTLGTLR